MAFKEKGTGLGLLWLRVLMGLGIAYHGYGKIFTGQMEMMIPAVEKLGFPMPAFFAWAAALSEFGGGLLIALGLFTKFAALMVFVTMTVAAFLAHGKDPLKAKELALAYWTAAGALVLLGPGAISLDAIVRRK